MTTESYHTVPISEADVFTLLRKSDGAVLVGGQALAFWVAYWGIALAEWPREYISGDADFLGFRRHVEAFAKALKGAASYPPQRAMTALVGAVTKQARGGGRIGVDVLAKLVGLDADGVRKRAIALSDPENPGKKYLVMNPIDCLVSRMENYRKLSDKRNEVGAWHCKIAILVAHAYLRSLIDLDQERTAINGATAILRWALKPAGLQIFLKEGIDILGAIPIEAFRSALFKEEQYARMTDRIRTERAKRKPKKR